MNYSGVFFFEQFARVDNKDGNTKVSLIRAPRGTGEFVELRSHRTHKRTFDYDYFPDWVETGGDEILYACFDLSE
ncbi:MAG: hypothetical protein SPG64_04715 [Candidatus Enteromonas sp.]|nr:hypothetical protein [Candidatus Enteromonas sp.]